MQCRPVLFCADQPATINFPYVNFEAIGVAADGRLSVAAPTKQFRIVAMSPGATTESAYVAIQSEDTGLYWSAANGGGGYIYVTSDIVGPNETFLYSLAQPFQFVTLKASNGQHVGLGLDAYPFVTADNPVFPPIGGWQLLGIECE
jgi:hypothetical protein